jgi:hypothetical protein
MFADGGTIRSNSTLSRKAGRKVDKSEVVRTLVNLLHTEPTLMDQVRRRLASQ